MNFWNLHIHSVDIYYSQNKEFLFLNRISERNFLKKTINPNFLYIIICNSCDQLSFDYNSKFKFKNKNASIFGTYDIIKMYNHNINFNYFQFLQLNNSFLIGTKNEIISEIYGSLNYLLKINEDLNIIKEKNEKTIFETNITLISRQTENTNLLKNLDNEKEINSKLNKEIKQLKEILNEKENKLFDLDTHNKNLGNDVEILNQNLKKNKNEINEINIALKEEKNNNKIISKKLIFEENLNKELKSKLDIISINNNENVKKVLNQVEKEQIINKNLESKISLLETQKKENIKKNEELKIKLKNKEYELDNIKKNIPSNIGLQFQCDCKTGEYDIILNIKSFKSLLFEGWEIKYNKKDGKQKYLAKKNEQTIIAGVIGNGNKGKSFILEKLSGYDIPKGFNVKTEGLSIRYATRTDHNIAILDSAGQETPLLKIEKEKSKVKNSKNNIFNKYYETPNESQENKDKKKIYANRVKNEELNEQKKEKNENLNIESDTEELEFEKYSRDKLLTEYFLQRFIIFKSHILILVIGNISLTEQKLLSRIKNEIRKLNKNKQLYVIHNLKDFTTEEQVNDYIENTLKKIYKIELEENIFQNIGQIYQNDNNKYFEKYFIERGQGVCHFIFVNEFSEKAKYYNIPTIKFIQQEMNGIKEKEKFSIIDDCKEFMIRISEEIMEEYPKIEDLETIEDEKSDRIILKNIKEINLKKFVIDEMGYTLNNDSNQPKYSYYINKEEKLFYVNIELPGGGAIYPSIKIGSSNYFFYYEGTKKGDEIIEEDKKCENKKLMNVKNLRKQNKFKLIIQIPCSIMQLKLDNDEDLDNYGEMTDDKKGIVTFKYKIIILNEKKEKKKQKVYNL